jgi:hypothetical protein
MKFSYIHKQISAIKTNINISKFGSESDCPPIITCIAAVDVNFRVNVPYIHLSDTLGRTALQYSHTTLHHQAHSMCIML